MVTSSEYQMAREVKKQTGDNSPVTESEAFVTRAAVCKMPVEIVHLKCGQIDFLPLSARGKTNVRYVGESPLVSVEPDKNGNMKMVFSGVGVVEVIYNSETLGSQGKNRGSHGKKKIYIVE